MRGPSGPRRGEARARFHRVKLQVDRTLQGVADGVLDDIVRQDAGHAVDEDHLTIELPPTRIAL